MNKVLRIKGLIAANGDHKILKGVDLTISPRQVTALMGTNGSGKSTLAQVIMGHHDFSVLAGTIKYGGRDILSLTPWQRSRLGLFLAFQYPYEVPGLNFYDFLLHLARVRDGNKFQLDLFEEQLQLAIRELRLSDKFLRRSLNQGFSGGEKKRAEILQLKILRPHLAILDETDSGLDIDALKLIAQNIRQQVKKTGLGVLVITHYQRLLDYLSPERVSVMQAGRIVVSGGKELVRKLEKRGYSWLKQETK